MGKFVIAPHMRLQEWVAEEKDYFKQEGLDYEFYDVKTHVAAIKTAAQLHRWSRKPKRRQRRARVRPWA